MPQHRHYPENPLNPDSNTPHLFCAIDQTLPTLNIFLQQQENRRSTQHQHTAAI